ILGFLAYLYAPLTPLALPGLEALKDTTLLAWSLTCLALTLSPLTGATVLWFRWAILLAYPLAFASAAGYHRLRGKGLKLGPLKLGKRFAAAALLANLALSATYLALPPKHQYNKYFGDWNPYKHYIPTSMLQNSLPLSDTPEAIQALRWVDQNHPNSTLVLHEAFHNWARLTTHNSKLIRVNEAELSSPLRQNASQRIAALAANASSRGEPVYTVWWTPGNGWYNMPSPPPGFHELTTFGKIPVFEYHP
ncbi:MAG: hypothetical protein ABWK01_01765, partial [Infirmifilum sp.]